MTEDKTKSVPFLSPANILYGPLHTKQAVDMFVRAVEEAKNEGGTVVYGGKVRGVLGRR